MAVAHSLLPGVAVAFLLFGLMSGTLFVGALLAALLVASSIVTIVSSHITFCKLPPSASSKVNVYAAGRVSETPSTRLRGNHSIVPPEKADPCAVNPAVKLLRARPIVA